MTTPSYPYLRCRTLQGHDWEDCPPLPSRPPMRGHTFVHFRCTRCGTVKRYEVHRATGNVHGGGPSYYNRPADYRTERATGDEWRRSFVRGITQDGAA